MIILLSVLIFILGACVGSFLNVVIFRLPKGEDIFRKRSYCPNCRKRLAPIDLIPMASFLILGGRCRTCGKPISIQYPVVEAVTGILFLASFISWGEKFGFVFQFLPQLLLWFLVVSVLILVFVIDLRFGIIPDQILKFAWLGSLVLILAGYFWPILANFFDLTKATAEFGRYLLEPLLLTQLKFAGFDLVTRLTAALLVAAFFGILILLTRGRGMGWGDVKFGFFLGFIFSLPQIFSVLFLSFVIGAGVSLILIIAKIKKFGQTVPFGPFLATASLIVLFFGERILNWYLSIIG